MNLILQGHSDIRPFQQLGALVRPRHEYCTSIIPTLVGRKGKRAFAGGQIRPYEVGGSNGTADITQAVIAALKVVG